MKSFEYQLHHFARAYGRFPWELPDDASLVVPQMAIMAADARGQDRAAKRAVKKAGR